MVPARRDRERESDNSRQPCTVHGRLIHQSSEKLDPKFTLHQKQRACRSERSQKSFIYNQGHALQRRFVSKRKPKLGYVFAKESDKQFCSFLSSQCYVLLSYISLLLVQSHALNATVQKQVYSYTLQVLNQPESTWIGFSGSADEPALFYPSPSVILLNQYGNVSNLTSTEAGFAVAFLCYANLELLSRDTQPSSMCVCSDTNCFTQTSLQDAQALSRNHLEGTIVETFQASVATFTDLRTTISGRNLRIAFVRFVQESYAGTYVTSNFFSVSPGILRAMRYTLDPSNKSDASCQRCTRGMYLAGSDIMSKVAMYDHYGNLMKFCDPHSPFCRMSQND
eukprot:768186-Hanusia_phi.AAC.2